MMGNRIWRVGRPNDGAYGGMALTRGHFERGEGEIPEAGDGEVLVKAEWFSPDPMNHAWVRGMPGKFDPIPPGSPMRGGIAGRVMQSRHPDWSVGDRVTGFLDWADYSVCNGADHLGVPLQRVPDGVPIESGLVALGMSGLCAWLGLSKFARPLPGDTVLVSGASGAIGSIAGQLAKLFGARVIGIAGGQDKCDFVRRMGFDDCADYKAPGLAAQISGLCPAGVNVFFDNVGGPLLDAALLNMAHFGSIVICGATAHYGAAPEPIINHMQLAVRSVTMRGFFYFDHIDLWGEGRARLTSWIKDGRLREFIDVVEGFENVPDAALAGFSGKVMGRKLAHISI